MMFSIIRKCVTNTWSLSSRGCYEYRRNHPQKSTDRGRARSSAVGGGGIFLATNIFLNLHKEKGILQKLPLTYLETCEKLKGN